MWLISQVTYILSSHLGTVLDLVLLVALPLAWHFLFVPFVPSPTIASGLTVYARPA